MPSRKSKFKKNQKYSNIINNNDENGDYNKMKINSDNKTVLKQAVNITLAGFCAVCWNNALYYCSDCCLVGYCCLSHMASHWEIHKNLCCAAGKIIANTGFLYGSKINDPDEWRYSRIKTMENIRVLLQRNLNPYERDLLLFPKHCSFCYETNYKKLAICKTCRQVWYCSNNCNHSPKNHSDWCKKLQLFATLVQKQARGELFMYDMNFGDVKKDKLQLNTNDNIKKAIKQVLKYSNELDDSQIAMISQASSGPLTMLFAIRLINFKVRNSLTIHLIGAELHYEGSTLQAWENFFMHFLPEISSLKIIMVGPELNASSTYETLRLKLNKVPTTAFETSKSRPNYPSKNLQDTRPYFCFYN